MGLFPSYTVLCTTRGLLSRVCKPCSLPRGLCSTNVTCQSKNDGFFLCSCVQKTTKQNPCPVNRLDRIREKLSARTSKNYLTKEAEEESLLVGWWFEPSQSRRLTSGLNKNFILSPSYSFHKSLYHKSYVWLLLLFSLFIFRGHSTREPAFSKVTYFILQACTVCS